MRLPLRLVLAGLGLVFAFTSLYLAGFHAPRAKGVDVGIVGTPAQATQLQSALDLGARGAFDVERFPTEAAARSALLDTGVHAVLVPSRAILVAGALGVAPTETVVTGLRRAAGDGAPVRDVRPLPAGDRRGLSSLFAVIGVLLPSLAFGAMLTVAGRGLPARTAWAAVLAYAAGAGVVAAFDADVVVGAFGGHFLALAGVCALLALAASATAHGLGRLGGPAGIAAAGALLLLLGVSSAGGAVTYQLQPGFYGAVSQLLPPGAALTAVRNVQYFDAAATLAPLLTLAAWAAAGLTLGSIGIRKGRQA